ncbi:MAG TPA: hypothetical protein O0X27_06140 [Methanocorpusculum sp.]|nr:hypothetical protein [Methanocorpusculum sp.]
MAVKCLADIVTSLISSADPLNSEEPSVDSQRIIATAELVPKIVCDLMRDIPIRTVRDMMLWALSAHANCAEISATYTYSCETGGYLCAGASMRNVRKMDISGICSDFSVVFSGMIVMAVEHDGRKIPCDELRFHKGDFLVIACGKQVDSIGGVW